MKGIGSTPLLRLRRLTDHTMAEVYVKYEGQNPTGSMKDRMALNMIEGAEKKGLIKPGDRIIEFTGGSSGTALALVCARKHYRPYFISSDAFSSEKLNTMRALGAELEILPSKGGKIDKILIEKGLSRISQLGKEPGSFWTDQFNNPDNKTAYHKMAREIINDLSGTPDVFVAAVGTGGCFSGNAEIFKSLPGITSCVAVEPARMRVLDKVDIRGAHRIEGIGLGYIPPLLRTDLIDRVESVTDEEAINVTRSLATREGIFAGISTGANVCIALKVARELGPDRKVVTIACDTGLKYLNSNVFIKHKWNRFQKIWRAISGK